MRCHELPPVGISRWSEHTHVLTRTWMPLPIWWTVMDSCSALAAQTNMRRQEKSTWLFDLWCVWVTNKFIRRVRISHRYPDLQATSKSFSVTDKLTVLYSFEDGMKAVFDRKKEDAFHCKTLYLVATIWQARVSMNNPAEELVQSLPASLSFITLLKGLQSPYNMYRKLWKSIGLGVKLFASHWSSIIYISVI